MYTLDANIFVRDANPFDADHRVCQELLERLYITRRPIVVPTIVLAEVKPRCPRGSNAVSCGVWPWRSNLGTTRSLRLQEVWDGRRY